MTTLLVWNPPFDLTNIAEGIIATVIVALVASLIALFIFYKKRLRFNQHVVQNIWQLTDTIHELEKIIRNNQEQDKYEELIEKFRAVEKELIMVAGNIKTIESK